MTTGETLSERHERIANDMVVQAEAELAAGDTLQAAEKMWGAASHALKSYCAREGLRHAKYSHRRFAVRRLAEERDDPTIWHVFVAAEACHAHFYNDSLEDETLEDSIHIIRELLEKILAK